MYSIYEDFFKPYLDYLIDKFNQIMERFSELKNSDGDKVTESNSPEPKLDTFSIKYKLYNSKTAMPGPGGSPA